MPVDGLLPHLFQGGHPLRRFPEFNPAVPEADFGSRGEVLFHAFEWLDLTARTNGLTTLFTFCDFRPVPGGIRKWMKKLEKKPAIVVYQELVKAMDKQHGTWADWFPIDQGLTVVEGLIAILRREGWKGTAARLKAEFPSITKGRIEPVAAEEVVGELTALAECLRIAGEAGARFRLVRTSPFPDSK